MGASWLAVDTLIRQTEKLSEFHAEACPVRGPATRRGDGDGGLAGRLSDDPRPRARPNAPGPCARGRARRADGGAARPGDVELSRPAGSGLSSSWRKRVPCVRVIGAGGVERGRGGSPPWCSHGSSAHSTASYPLTQADRSPLEPLYRRIQDVVRRLLRHRALVRGRDDLMAVLAVAVPRREEPREARAVLVVDPDVAVPLQGHGQVAQQLRARIAAVEAEDDVG